jgi:hypothetical protein
VLASSSHRVSWALAALLSFVVGDTRAEEWLPLAVGNQWTYRSDHDIQYTYPDRPIVRAYWSGKLEERVDESGERTSEREGPLLYRLIRTSRDVSGLSATAPNSYFVQWLTVLDGRVRLRAIQTPGVPPPLNQVIRYAEPLLLVQSEMEAGARWRVGSWAVGNLAVDLTATVTGREGVVVPDGSYPAATAVRYEGPVTGSIEVAGEWALIESGSFVRTWWLAPGVGLIKEEVDLTFSGVIAEKTAVEGHTTTLRELISHDLVAARPPPRVPLRSVVTRTDDPSTRQPNENADGNGNEKLLNWTLELDTRTENGN